MSKQALHELLAHRPPMLLLDTLVSVDADGSCCEMTVSQSTPFLNEDSSLPGWIGIELMAQAIAVWGGWQSKNENRDVNIGMLLGSRKYESQVKAFPQNSRLIVKVTKIIRDGNLGVFDCSISLNEKVVSKAQVSTYLPDEDDLKTILERQI